MPREQQDFLTQRLVLTIAGSVAFSGLAFLAYHYTAPFADPPAYAATASATAVTRSVPVLAEDAAARTEESAGASVEMAVPETVAAPQATAAPTSAAVAQRAEHAIVAEANNQQPAAAANGGPASPAAKTAAVEVPASDDPRWGLQPPVASAPTVIAPTGEEPLAYASDKPATAALKRAVVDDATDETETAAIDRTPPASATLKPEAPATTGAAPTATATIARGVNMRARGAKGARVIGTIPRGATVGLVACDSWCEVIYEGRRGFIYKSFIDSASRTADASEAAQPRKPSKPKIVPVQQSPANDFDNTGR